MSTSQFSRRAVLAVLGALPASPAGAAPARRVVLLGDSIAAGFGLPRPQALPARLQAQLARLGVPATVLLAAGNGRTTADGAARVDREVPATVDLCVVALGANDLLLGREPTAIRRDLERIVGRLKARRVPVLLAGVQVPPVLGADYAREFDAAFAAVARAHRLAFLPNLLAGVALNPGLNQQDGLHPNAAGVEVIVRRLAPLVAQALKSR